MEPVTLAVVSLAVLMLLLSFGVPIVFCFSGALAFMSIVGGVTMKGMMMWGLQQIDPVMVPYQPEELAAALERFAKYDLKVTIV